MKIVSAFFRREMLLAAVLGFSDGILTALTLAAGRLTSAGESVSVDLGLRIATGALASGAFVFFVARYSELRHELIRSERQLNLTSHGRLAAGRLGTEVRHEAIRAGVTSSLAAFCGALVPLMAAALVPQHQWVSILAALLALAALGLGLARAVHGSRTRWSLGLAAGGILLSLLGAFLKIV